MSKNSIHQMRRLAMTSEKLREFCEKHKGKKIRVTIKPLVLGNWWSNDEGIRDGSGGRWLMAWEISSLTVEGDDE